MEAARGDSRSGAGMTEEEAAAWGFGAVLGEIPAAERGYDGGGGAGVTDRGAGVADLGATDPAAAGDPRGRPPLCPRGYSSQ